MASNSFNSNPNIELVTTRSTARSRTGGIDGDLTLPASRFITGGQTAKYDPVHIIRAKLTEIGCKTPSSIGLGRRSIVQRNVSRVNTDWRGGRNSSSRYADHPPARGVHANTPKRRQEC